MKKEAGILAMMIVTMTIIGPTYAVGLQGEDVEEQRRILAFFITTKAGFRFPMWLQIIVFIILVLVMLASIAMIVLFSQNNAGPARLNPMVIQNLRMKGKLPSVGMGARNIGMVNQRMMMKNQMGGRKQMQMGDLDSSAANLNYGQGY